MEIPARKDGSRAGVKKKMGGVKKGVVKFPLIFRRRYFFTPPVFFFTPPSFFFHAAQLFLHAESTPESTPAPTPEFTPARGPLKNVLADT